MLLPSALGTEQVEAIVSVMEEVDLLTDFLNQSLDVAEAKADALRLDRTSVDLDELLKSMVDLYRPSMADRGLQVTLRSAGPVMVEGDAALIHRLVGNLFDNELKHLPAAGKVTIQLQADHELASLRMEDDGPGFAPDVLNHLFESRVKGKESSGRGLGLAFVDAVTRAHGGQYRHPIVKKEEPELRSLYLSPATGILTHSVRQCMNLCRFHLERRRISNCVRKSF